MYLPYQFPAPHPLTRPAPIYARQRMLGQPVAPLYSHRGGAPIEPLYYFFAHGDPIGGPVGESFRGVRAGGFPALAVVFGPGGPIGVDPIGIAGAPIGM